MDKNFKYGIASVKFGDKTIGYIEKGSWDWGGTKPESTDVEAEQVPDAPVLTILTKNASISPTFNIIQLDYENIHTVLGGTLVGSSGNYTGWKAPTSLVQLSGNGLLLLYLARHAPSRMPLSWRISAVSSHLQRCLSWNAS